MKIKIYFNDGRVIDGEVFTKKDFSEFSKDFFELNPFTIISNNTNSVSINTKQVLFIEELK